MTIKIKVSHFLRQFIKNQDTIEVEGSTVSECLDDLVRQFPDIKKWLFDRNGVSRVITVINGEGINQEDWNKPITDGCELHLILIAGGG